jgi:RNA polymerase sigma-70 factor, ECF subfamily
MDDVDSDLELAIACRRGDETALKEFERRFGDDIDRAISKSPTLGISRDEFRQLMRQKLFVAMGERPPSIAKYEGKGPLKSWVRVVATRLVLDLARRAGSDGPGKRPLSDEDLARQLPPAQDAEIEHLRRAYGEILPAAFEEALTRLTVRQRNLLRHRYLHQLTVQRMAAVYDVHRSTMFEWLSEARSDLLGHVRSALSARVPEQNLESIVAVLGSKLELSVRRMLDSDLE